MNIAARRIEPIVIDTLTQAAKDWNRSRGPFVPYACNRIHAALRDMDKARCRYKPRFSGRRKYRYDMLAIKKGIMMHPQ